MDRLLKPEKFDTLSEDSKSTKIFNYWLRIFEGFIAAVAANAGENEEIKQTFATDELLDSQNLFFYCGS